MEVTKYKNSFSEAEFNSKLEEMQNQQTAFLDKRESALFGTAVLSDLGDLSCVFGDQNLALATRHFGYFLNWAQNMVVYTR